MYEHEDEDEHTRHGTARHGTALHSAAHLITARHSMAQRCYNDEHTVDIFEAHTHSFCLQ